MFDDRLVPLDNQQEKENAAWLIQNMHGGHRIPTLLKKVDSISRSETSTRSSLSINNPEDRTRFGEARIPYWTQKMLPSQWRRQHYFYFND